MRRMISVTALIVAVFALLMIGACAQEKKAETAEPVSGQGTPAGDSTVIAAPTQQVAPGKVIVDEEILIGFVDEPNHHFGLARESYLKKDYAKASTEMLKGAGFVKLEATRATGDAQRMLSDAVIRLAELAQDVKGGSVASVDKLDAAFAHAEQALAYHHEVKAQEYWKAENHKSAGQDLKAASMHLENSMKYAGEKTEADTKAIMKDASDFGQKLIEGTAQAADKTGKAMQNLGTKIEEWGKRMIAPKK